jgi:hypothetical protein
VNYEDVEAIYNNKIYLEIGEIVEIPTNEPGY